MKAFLEQYGQFMVSMLVGIVLFGLLYGATIKNTELMDRAIPDEEDMALNFLNVTSVTDSSKIPVIELCKDQDGSSAIVVLIDPRNNANVDYMSPTILINCEDGEHNKVTAFRHVSMKYARTESKLQDDVLNIIGADAVNTQEKGDYKVTYYYRNSKTGYKNMADLTVCVRRPYTPYQYIHASTGTQRIETGITPLAGDPTLVDTTSLTIEYQPDSVSGRQDIVWTEGNLMKFGIFISNGYWGYAYGDGEYLTNIPATTSKKQTITIDSINKTFSVDSNERSFAAITLGGVALNNTEAIRTAYPNGYPGNGHIILLNPSQGVKGKIYSCQIYAGKLLRRNFFPAYSKGTNTLGLWETVDWAPYYNSNQPYPPFEPGPKVEE